MDDPEITRSLQLFRGMIDYAREVAPRRFMDGRGAFDDDEAIAVVRECLLWLCDSPGHAARVAEIYVAEEAQS